MASMRLGPLLLFTPAFDDTVRFYERLLGVPARRIHDGYAEIAAGAVTLALHRSRAGEEGVGPLHLHFETDDVEAAASAARSAGASAVGEPQVQPWGREVTVVDPGGFSFELVELPR
jgi:predicted enzyme related to lactoylglutathione lyase